MKNQQGAPEALIDPSPDQLRAIARTARNSSGSASDDCGPLAYVLHGWRAAAIASRAQQAALVEAQQPATHVQNPAEIEHVAGDVSKNGPKSNMAQQPAPSEQQPFGWIKQSEIDSSNDFGGSINLWRQKYDCDVPVYLAQQPAPSAAAALSDDLRDGLVAISEAIADQDDRAAQAMLREILAAPQPFPTPQADSQPALGLQNLHNLLYLAQRQTSKAAMERVVSQARLELARMRDASPHAESVKAASTGELLMGLAVIRELTGTQKNDLESTVDAVRAAFAPADSVTAPAMDESYKQAVGSKNCMQCCVSYMLGLPLESVPDFATAGGWDRFASFAESQGYAAVMFPGNHKFEADYLASGATERGTQHMVVMNDGKLVHDPHPSNAGLVEVQCVWLLAKKAGAQWHHDERAAFEASAKAYTSNVSFERDGDDYADMTASLLWHGWKLRAARAPADSVTAPAGGANWQDISTAPKDGTRFVAVGQNYGLDSETQHTCIAQWLAGCWVEVSDWNGASKLKYLTHWMPLPPLPGRAASATADSQPSPVVDKCTKQQMTTEVLHRMQQQEDGHNKNPFRSLLDRLMRNEGGYSTIEIGQLKYALDGFYGAARAPADSVTAPAGGVTVTDDMVLAALRVQYPAAYGQYLRHPANGPKTSLRTESEIDTAQRMIVAALSAAPTPPAQAADSVLEDAARLEQIAEAIRDYHHALDMRKHGGLAESAAFSSICNTMGMHWNRGEEAARRAARKQGGANG